MEIKNILPICNRDDYQLDSFLSFLKAIKFQYRVPTIHIAGTNGKGSICAYLSQILIESGYKTGQFTSPYVYEFSERIRINNEMISTQDLKEVTLRVKEAADKFAQDDHPTEFELMTAVAFTYFASLVISAC